MELNRKGFRTTMDILGEDTQSLDQARKAQAGYLELLREIHNRKLDANVSIKLTQFGLKLDAKVCFDLVDELVRTAETLSNFVRIDMEDHTCTSDTLAIYRRLRATHQNVGVVVQAYLRRTLDDVTTLLDLQPNFRLCKGVYREDRSVAYQDMRIINRNYVAVLRCILEGGCYVGIATHDETIVWEAYQIIRKIALPPSRYEFQMLLGVDEPLRDMIRRDGHELRVYIPFGRDWYAYSVRRLRENPRLAGYVLRAMFK